MKAKEMYRVKVLIMKCSGENYWYKHKIGNTFKVCNYNKDAYKVDLKRKVKLILKKDCQVI